MIAAKCAFSLRSVERLLAETVPTREEIAVDQRAAPRGLGRPRIVADTFLERIRVVAT